MYCPNCGQERTSIETSFCSRCGFLLTGTAELLLTGGIIPSPQHSGGSKRLSSRSRGIRQGLFIFLLSFLVLPLLTVFSIMINLRTPALVVVAGILLVVGGLLRMAWAMMFEDADPDSGQQRSATVHEFKRPADALPEGRSIPASAYAAPKAGNWRDTNDLQPVSVVEGTTKLLETESK